MGKKKVTEILKDLKYTSKNAILPVDLHMHTTWTDGQDNEIDMFNSAIKCGLKYVLFSEHVRRGSDEWFSEFAGSVRKLSNNECTALVGAETRVEDFTGNLDCTTAIINQCDLIIASVHRFPAKGGVSYREFSEVSPEEALDIEFRLSNAILENPDVDILGHPFGMSLSRFKVVPPIHMIKALIAKAAKYNVAFEINTHYHPDPWGLIDLCKQVGAPISLGSDAHSTGEVGRIMRVLKGEEKSWKL